MKNHFSVSILILQVIFFNFLFGVQYLYRSLVNFEFAPKSFILNGKMLLTKAAPYPKGLEHKILIKNEKVLAISPQSLSAYCE